MLKHVLLVSTILFTGATNADIFKCWFNDPFTAVTYSMAQQELTIYTTGGDPKPISNVSFHVRGPIDFELQKAGKVVMSLKLTRKGKDGDNDYPYPFESAWNGKSGVCESNFLRRVE